MDRCDNLLAQGKELGPIGFEWMFGLLKNKYQGKPGEAIMKLMAQLEATNQVNYSELDEGAQDPEGAWDWLSGKRGDLQSLGRGLENREIYDYFTKCEKNSASMPIPSGGKEPLFGGGVR